jgi:hypothetical protein
VNPLESADPRRIGGHRLLARLGRGGMGQVHLAERGPARRGRGLVAVKVVRDEPSNVLMARDGPRVIDFGIARLLYEQRTRLTETGQLVGTPGYMSPEQINDEELTAAGDIFTLGLVAYYAATGEHLYEARDWRVLGLKTLRSEPDLDARPGPFPGRVLH